MTDEQDGQPRRQPIDSPTVMGPSAGHLHGPAPEEPTLPATRPEEPDAPPSTPSSNPPENRAGAQDEPSHTEAAPPTNPSDEPTLGAPEHPAAPQNEPTHTEAAPPTNPRDEPPLGAPKHPTAPRDETTLAEAAPPTNPRDEPTLGAPAQPEHPAAPRDELTVADPNAPAFTPHDEPTLASPAPAPNWPDVPEAAAPVADAASATPPSTWSSNPPRDVPTPPPNWPNPPETAPPVNDAAPATWSSSPPTPTWPDGPTVATPIDEITLPDAAPDGPTMAVVDESPTTTGPTVASWPLDELLPPPPTDLVWRPDTPEPPPSARRPGYYIALGASVVLVVALIAVAALATVMRPTRDVAGTARPTQGIPDITAPSTEPPVTTSTQPPRQGAADHPLSTSDARMADATCALPRFDLADDRQAAFYAAAKICADDAWRGVLEEAGLQATVEVVTVTSPVATRSCGEITPDSPATQCDGTVYMTPAHLRDAEQNGRYPGRYFGVFLREYASALQFTTGLSELAATEDDAETRLAQQATCMAGIASGAMANRGAVDANITGEISDRLSSVDAPPDAKAMLDKGSQERTLQACNTW
jgi:hypothetical protein